VVVGGDPDRDLLPDMPSERRSDDNGCMPKLSDAEVRSELQRLPGWARVGDEIVREYELESFPAVIDAVVRIGEAAEAADHHPDLDIRYRRLRVALTTHDQGGLTAKDVALAHQIDAAAATGS